ncbi:hypothetical protein Vretifemale_10975, partial [Volvox reticuliferus]
MNSVLILHGRLAALSACAEKLDVRGRAAMVSVALEIASPSQQFLSDLYDVCTLSVASSKCTAGNAPDDSLSSTGSVSGECVSGGSAAQLCATCTAAALHYLSQQDGRVVQQFLDAFFLPLLSQRAALPDKTCRLQACTGLVALLISNRLWSQLEQLVRRCCHALETAATVDPGGASKLPLPVACTLLTVTVQQLCPLVSVAEELTAGVQAWTRGVWHRREVHRREVHRREVHRREVQDDASRLSCTPNDKERHLIRGATPASNGENTVTTAANAANMLRWLLSQLRPALRSLLPSPSASARQTALRVLVPITLNVAQACGEEDVRHVSETESRR